VEGAQARGEIASTVTTALTAKGAQDAELRPQKDPLGFRLALNGVNAGAFEQLGVVFC
jgi:hypothetical protein